MILREKEFLNYMYCPLKFLLGKTADTERKTYNTLLHETFNDYIKRITSLNKQHNLNTLKHKWDKTCEDNRDLIGSKKVIEGWGLLFGAFKYIVDNNIVFEDTSETYNIEFPGSGVVLTGNISPYSIRDDLFEVTILSFSKTMPDRNYADMNIKHTIDAYALKTMFNKNTVFKYHSVYLNQDLYTFRTDNSFDRLETSIVNVGRSIKQNLIYPRESYACSTCLCKGLCKAWTGKNNN